MRGYYTLNEQIIPIRIEVQNDTRALVVHTGGDDIITKFLKERAVFITPYEELLTCADPRSLRIVMNPTKLQFGSDCFDQAYCFFSFFYIQKHQAIFENINKVLKRWGKFHIWDAEIPKRFGHNSFFVVPVLVDTGLEMVKIVHVVKWKGEQILPYFKKVARESGFKISNEKKYDKVFYLELSKIAEIKKR